MIGWIKSLFKEDQLSKDIGKVPEVKQAKGKNISEPVLSFVKCVQENPKRFLAESSQSTSYYVGDMNPEDYRGYKIYDKVAKKGWYLLGKYFSNSWFVHGYPGEGGPFYSDPFFLTEDEKAYILKEVKLVMDYRGERKIRLEQVRKERRIRDERNRLKEIYK